MPIEIRDLDFEYKNKNKSLKIFHNFSLDLKDDKFVSFIGPSGCGKSTFLRLLSGLETNYLGEIKAYKSSPNLLLKNRQVGFAFQDPVLLTWKNVIENIELPERIMNLKKTDLVELLRLVELEKFKDFYPEQLSGGMQQRVALARCLSYHPSLILMDEPFGSLDEFARFKMNQILYNIWKTVEDIKNIIFVTHSIEEAVLLSDEIIILSDPPIGKDFKKIEIDLDRTDLVKTRIDDKYYSYIKQIRFFIHGA